MEMNNTKAYPLKIGTMSLYCDKMTMESGTLVSVSPTVTGISYITNKCKPVSYTHLTLPTNVNV